MNEKKIVQPARKRKSSEPNEEAAAKKSAKVKKTVKTAESKGVTSEKKAESKDFVINADGELKPAKKKKTTGKKLQSEKNAPELSAVASNELAEAIQTVEEIIEKPGIVKTPRKKTVAKAAKTKISRASSDSIVKKAEAKKASAKAKKLPQIKSETIETEKAPAAGYALDSTSKKEESPIFKELSEPKLPTLPQENRARLQIQSPNRIFFYWSVKHNPFQTLHRAFPADCVQDYKFSIKLVNLNSKTEEVYPVEAVGSWWFDVDPNTSYRAEVGFSAPRRPFVRLMYSNAVETPRAEPSPNRDLSTQFRVSANQFAEVLDASGYAQDAVEVALTGDNLESSDAATQKAFFSLSGDRQMVEGDLSELRSALLALAAGAALESLREQISRKLFAQLEAILQENAGKLSAEKVRNALKENFELEDEQEEFLTPVFGASAINFPRKPRLPKTSPVSSLRKTI